MATNLWANADLESGIDDWNQILNATLSHSSAQAWEETYSLLNVVPVNTTVTWRSDVKSVVSGSTQYTASMYVRTDNASLPIRFIVRDQDLNIITTIGDQTFTADTWTRITNTFTTEADDTGVAIEMKKSSSAEAGDFFLDAVMLETGASASTWVNYSDGSETLVVADCAHAHTADSPVITQGGSLTVADCTHAHTAVGFQGGDGLWEVGAYIYPLGGNEIILETNDTGLSVADCAHAHTVESTALTQSNTLAVNDTAHIVAADSLLLGNIALSVDDAFHSASTQNVTLTGPGFPSPDDGSLLIPFLRRKRRG